jgi:hypothetical protein
MPFEINDGIGDQLSRPMECSLTPSQRLMEFGASIGTEICLLLRVYRTDFASATGIDGVKFGGYDGGRRDGEVRIGFAGEEAAHEDILEV